MKNRWILTLAMLVALLATTPGSGHAAANAVPNTKLFLRSGPNTKYESLGSQPQSTRLTAIEYESGNGVTWVLVEYLDDGEVCRGYTGLKRMSVQGGIPWASHLNQPARITCDSVVYAAPAIGAAYRGYVLDGDPVTVLGYENGYAYIEFESLGGLYRGYVEAWMADRSAPPRQPDYRPDYKPDYKPDRKPDYEAYGGTVRMVDATPTRKLAFRTGPSSHYVWLYGKPASTKIRAIEYENSSAATWVLLEFTHKGQTVRAYTGLQRMNVHGDIPWASHLNRPARIGEGGTVYAAPTGNAAWRGSVGRGEQVTLLRYEGDYAFIEFSDAGTPSRGYVFAWMVEG